eukprot:2940208-Rhodomonas_salina.1
MTERSIVGFVCRIDERRALGARDKLKPPVAVSDPVPKDWRPADERAVLGGTTTTLKPGAVRTIDTRTLSRVRERNIRVSRAATSVGSVCARGGDRGERARRALFGTDSTLIFTVGACGAGRASARPCSVLECARAARTAHFAAGQLVHIIATLVHYNPHGTFQTRDDSAICETAKAERARLALVRIRVEDTLLTDSAEGSRGGSVRGVDELIPGRAAAQYPESILKVFPFSDNLGVP